MPFNEASVPILLRIFEDHANSENYPELLEGLQKRYHKLLLESGKEVGIVQTPKTIEEVIVFAAVDLNMSI